MSKNVKLSQADLFSSCHRSFLFIFAHVSTIHYLLGTIIGIYDLIKGLSYEAHIIFDDDHFVLAPFGAGRCTA